MLGILHSHLTAQIDSNLKATASRIKTNDLVDLLDKGTFQGNQPTNYFVRVNYAGQVAEATSSAAAVDRGRPDSKALELAERSRDIKWEKPFTIAGESSSSWRAIMLPIRSDQTPKITGTLIVALPLQTVTQTVTATGINVLGTSLIIILVGGVLAYVLVHVSLRPLRQMEEVAGKIASGTCTNVLIYPRCVPEKCFRWLLRSTLCFLGLKKLLLLKSVTSKKSASLFLMLLTSYAPP